MTNRLASVFLSSLLLLVVPAHAGSNAKDMLAAGRIDETISALNGHLSNSPSDAESFNLLCRAYFALEDWNRAESACRRAVTLDPGNGRYHLWLGRTYGEKADRSGFLSA